MGNRLVPAPVRIDPKYVAALAIRVAGIPALAGILAFRAAVPGYSSGRPQDRYPAEPAEMDWEICDRRGRPAPWLDRKLSARERADIERDLIGQLERERREYANEARIAAYRDRDGD